MILSLAGLVASVDVGVCVCMCYACIVCLSLIPKPPPQRTKPEVETWNEAMCVPLDETFGRTGTLKGRTVPHFSQVHDDEEAIGALPHTPSLCCQVTAV